MKRCHDCDVEKPLDQFWRNRASADGRATYCIPCFSRRNRQAAERRAAREGRTLPPSSPRPSDLASDEKYCPSCQQVLPLTSFVRNRSAPSGFGSYCRPCQAEKSAASLKRVHGSARHYHLRRRYGLGADEVLSRLEAQGSSCLICRRPITAKTAHIDHDHVTGKVRGILCFRCNSRHGSASPTIRRFSSAPLATCSPRPSCGCRSRSSGPSGSPRSSSTTALPPEQGGPAVGSVRPARPTSDRGEGTHR